MLESVMAELSRVWEGSLVSRDCRAITASSRPSMLVALVGDISGVSGIVLPVLRRWKDGCRSVGTGGGGTGAYWRGGMAFISSPSPYRGKVPDMGVMIGDEMLTAFMFFFRGDLRIEDRIDDPRDCDFSSLSRLRPMGLFFSFLSVPP
jgi:hypothetical protein